MQRIKYPDRTKLEQNLQEKQRKVARLTEIWDTERAEIETIKRSKEDLEKAHQELDQARRKVDFGKADKLQYGRRLSPSDFLGISVCAGFYCHRKTQSSSSWL